MNERRLYRNDVASQRTTTAPPTCSLPLKQPPPSSNAVQPLRLFDSSDLPTERGGTFVQPSTTSTNSVSMSRSRIHVGVDAEVAGVADDDADGVGSGDGQPTLRRFSRYNHSIVNGGTKRPVSIGIFDDDSEGLNRQVVIGDGNWTVRARTVEKTKNGVGVRPSIIAANNNNNNITIVPIGCDSIIQLPPRPRDTDDEQKKTSLRISLTNPRKTTTTTSCDGANGNRLAKSGSLSEFVDDHQIMSTTAAPPPLSSTNRRCIVVSGGAKSVGPSRPSVHRSLHHETFLPPSSINGNNTTNRRCDRCCCCNCLSSSNGGVCRTTANGGVGHLAASGGIINYTNRPQISSNTKSSPYRITDSQSTTSSSTPTPQFGSRGSGFIRNSCPDLRTTNGSGRHVDVSNNDDNNLHRSNVIATDQQQPRNRNRKAKEKRKAALWAAKRVIDWTLDDVLLWLQHVHLDDVASIMIGYDLNGADILKWNDEKLAQLGVVNESLRKCVLKELSKLVVPSLPSQQQLSSPSPIIPNTTTRLHNTDRLDETTTSTDGPMIRISKQKPSPRSISSTTKTPLYNLVRSASYDRIIAIETSLTTRDVSVAEGHLGCLQVTKVNGAGVPLLQGDCLLEVNNRPGQSFRSLTFTKLISDAAGDPIKLVILRRKIDNDDDDYDDERMDLRLPPFIRSSTNIDPIGTIEQQSTGSSGISSSEQVDSPSSLDGDSHIVRL